MLPSGSPWGWVRFVRFVRTPPLRCTQDPPVQSPQPTPSHGDPWPSLSPLLTKLSKLTKWGERGKRAGRTWFAWPAN